MNVNGSQFFHLLGKGDWGQCSARFNRRQQTLASIWSRFGGSAAGPDVPVWNAGVDRITLAETGEALPPTKGEPVLLPMMHRATACDRFGNVYVIGDDPTTIRVVNADQRDSHAFWPDDRNLRAKANRDFADATPAGDEALAFNALAVTTANYLIVAARSATRQWLLRFDLVGGGAPVGHEVTALLPQFICDLVADHCDGLWVLTPTNVLRFGPDLQPQDLGPQAPVRAAFQPVAAGDLRFVEPAMVAPLLPMPPATDARQIALTAQGELIVHARNGSNVSQLFVLDAGGVALRFVGDLPTRIHVIAIGPLPTEPDERPVDGEALFAVPLSGNQALLFRFDRDIDGLIQSVQPEPAIIPLRRFGGRGLQLRQANIVYDSGTADPAWIPTVVQIRRRYATANTIISAVFDAREPQCVWDRIRLDATIPPGTDILVEARANDDQTVLETMGEAGWVAQPSFYLNSDGGELPGKRSIAQLPTDRLRGQGCWDMLLQNIAGRYGQLRITLRGDGRHTPTLRSMRIWYPRFSYAERFLPALYREDAFSGFFVERFLANMEGINSAVEGQIAAMQAQFDPRTAHGNMLDWLAGWFDVMLDPAWNEDRRRLFIANAAEFLGWRGTIAGLKLGLRLAFDAQLTSADFRLGAGDCTCAGSIRIVEAFSVQAKGRKFDKVETSDLGGPATRIIADSWSPAEGSAGLVARLSADSVWSPTGGRFPLFAPGDGVADWESLAQQCFGFVPALGAAERAAWQAYCAAWGDESTAIDLPSGFVDASGADRWATFLTMQSKARRIWQRYLQNRYRTIDALNSAHQTVWTGFAEIALPDYLPVTEAAITDWLLFEGQLYPRQSAAHRFSVLIPLASVNANASELDLKMALARRIIEIEKPAHTVFDVRFYWAMNRVGEARIGQDTGIGAGSRAPELIPPAIVGQAYLGSNFVGGPQGRTEQRERLTC
jgi:phage tail-like protein